MFSLATSVEIGEVCSSEWDTRGGALLSSTMIDDDEDFVDESAMLKRLVSGSKQLCSEAIA
ncbi:hypothetical protein Tco_0028275, partial [Tanacetum coccineum]